MEMEMFPSVLKYASWVFGLRFSSDGKMKQLGFTFIFHMFYLYNVITTEILSNTQDNTKGISVQVFQVCRMIAAIFTMVKLFRIYLATETIEQLTAEVLRQKTIMNINKMTSKTFICCIGLITTLCLSTIYNIWVYVRDGSLDINDTFQWFFADIRDAIECDFVYNLYRYIHYLFSHLNRKFESVLDGISKYPNIKRKVIEDIEQKYIDDSISLIKKISKMHIDITKIMREFELVLSFNAALFIARKFVDSVAEAYYYIHLERDYLISWALLWTVYSIILTSVLIYSWVSCQFEANRTVIILHDIWNKYAERKGIDKKLLYLQFISMRFLSCKLKFTAYGFFPLDWSFLHTIVASATTYIIILVQLKK